MNASTPSQRLDRRDWTFAAIGSLVAVLLANVPYVYGYFVAEPSRPFLGDARAFIDTNTYLAWIRQSADGHWLFRDLYTTEPHSRSLFHPLFLVLGRIARATGLSPEVVHGGARVVFGLLFLLLAFRFVAFFVEGRFERRATFVLLSVSGGLGWLHLFEPIRRISESWFLIGWIESNSFLSIYALPLFAVSLVFLVLTFGLMVRAFEERRGFLAVLSGIASAVLFLIHFFDVGIVYAVLLLFVLARWIVWKDRAALVSDAKLAAIHFGVSAPAVALNFALSLINPVFREHAWKGATTLAPSFWLYCGAFGLVGVLACIGAVEALIARSSQEEVLLNRRLFLVVWAVAVPFLVFAPLPFQRRFVEGVHIAMAILAGLGIAALVRRFGWKRGPTWAVAILLTVPGNAFLLWEDTRYLGANVHGDGMAGFVSRDLLDAAAWIRQLADRGAVLFSSYETGNYLPALTGNPVYIGHSPQTLRFEEKARATQAFFAVATPDEARRGILSASGAAFVVHGPRERLLGAFEPSRASYLREVFRKGGVAIYAVELGQELR